MQSLKGSGRGVQLPPRSTIASDELYWLAGFLEGEGSFMKGPPSAPNRPTISMVSTDLDVAERVARLLGVNYIQHTRPTNKKWKKQYSVLLRGAKAVAMMELLRPLMGERRRQQIDKARASYVPRPKSALTRDQKHYVGRSRMPLAWLARKFGVTRAVIIQAKKTYLDVTCP